MLKEIFAVRFVLGHLFPKIPTLLVGCVCTWEKRRGTNSPIDWEVFFFLYFVSGLILFWCWVIYLFILCPGVLLSLNWMLGSSANAWVLHLPLFPQLPVTLATLCSDGSFSRPCDAIKAVCASWCWFPWSWSSLVVRFCIGGLLTLWNWVKLRLIHIAAYMVLSL